MTSSLIKQRNRNHSLAMSCGSTGSEEGSSSLCSHDLTITMSSSASASALDALLNHGQKGCEKAEGGRQKSGAKCSKKPHRGKSLESLNTKSTKHLLHIPASKSYQSALLKKSRKSANDVSDVETGELSEYWDQVC